MRKNAVDNSLTPIVGGVCAPRGFSASGLSCNAENSKENIALIFGKKRCAVACVGAQGGTVGAPVLLSKKHAKSGYAHAVFCNSGTANVLQVDGMKIAENICERLAKTLRISKEETLIASTGRIGAPYPEQAIFGSLDALVNSLGEGEENSLAAMQAVASDDAFAGQLSFSFYLGSYPCTIGAIYKGQTQVHPNMATTLCFLTTDVNISPQMLQKALSSATSEDFNRLCLDGVSSPNDFACILANGEAGNYKIACADSEYKKFARILCDVVAVVCGKIAEKRSGKMFTCTVTGATSKRIAYTLADKTAACGGIRAALQRGEADVNALYAVLCGELPADSVRKAVIMLRADGREYEIADDGAVLPLSENLRMQILSAAALELRIALRDGNYGATSYGFIP